MKELGGRTTEILDFLLPYMETCFAETCKIIQIELDRNAGKIWDDLESILCVALSRTENMQKRHRKGNVHYIVFSFLRASIYVDKVELRMDIMDDGFYLDEQEVTGYYCPVFLQDKYLKDLEFLFSMARKRFIRLQHFELMEIRERYADYYDAFLYRMVESLSGKIKELPTKYGIDLGEDFKIIYGEYMGRACVL